MEKRRSKLNDIFKVLKMNFGGSLRFGYLSTPLSYSTYQFQGNLRRTVVALPFQAKD